MDVLERGESGQKVSLTSREHSRPSALALKRLSSRNFRRLLSLSVTCAIVPIGLAGLLTSLLVRPIVNRTYWTTHVIVINPPSREGLNRLFHLDRYTWPPLGAVPDVGIRHLPPWLNKLPANKKKILFFQLLLPLAVAANNQVRRQRHYIQHSIHELDTHPAQATPARLLQLASKYQVSGSLRSPRIQKQLLRRCDTVPEGLLLAQAANESGWGTSVFARTINNLFGIWTWQPDAGVAPTDRNPESTHLVRAYRSVEDSIRDYIFNLDVGFDYRNFRTLRAAMRSANKPLQPIVLATALTDYSQRRKLYVLRLEQLIINNHLEAIVHPRLAVEP